MKTTYLVISKFTNNSKTYYTRPTVVSASGSFPSPLLDDNHHGKPYKLLLYREKFGKYLLSSFEIINWRIPGEDSLVNVMQDIVNNSEMTYLYIDVDGYLWQKNSENRNKTIEELYVSGQILPIGVYEHYHLIKSSELYNKIGIKNS